MENALHEQFAYMETTWDKLRKCIRMYEIAVNNDIAIAEIAGIMRYTKKAVTMTFGMLNQLPRIPPGRTVVTGMVGGMHDTDTTTEERNEYNDQDKTNCEGNHNDEGPLTLGNGPADLDTVPDGILRYVRPLCDTSGNPCRDEIGQIEATITGFPLSRDQTKLDELLNATGRAVANTLINSGYRLEESVRLIRVYVSSELPNVTASIEACEK